MTDKKAKCVYIITLNRPKSMKVVTFACGYTTYRYMEIFDI